MKELITILLLMLTTATWAQVEVGDVISNKHKDKIENLEDPRAKLKKYRKFYSKDSTRQVKELEQQAVNRMDSIGKTLKAQQKKLKEKLPETPTPDLSGLSKPKNIDIPELPSLDQENAEQVVKKEVDQLIEKEAQEDFSKYTEELKGLKLDSSQIATYKDKVKQQVIAENKFDDQGKQVEELKNLKLDSTQLADYKAKGLQKGKAAIGKVEEKAADKAGVSSLKEQQKAFEPIKDTPEKYKKLAEEYQDKGQLKEKAKKASREKASQFFIANQDKLMAQQKKMGLLKGSYASVLNSNDLSTAVKVNSLKGKTFRERLIIGGDFQLVEAKPLTIAASPMIGYRFNKRLSTGLGANIRISQKKDDPTLQSVKKDGSEAKGGKAFVQYILVKSFHAIAEYELSYTEVPVVDLDKTTKEWVPGIFVGVGKKIPIHSKVDASISVLYNFVYDATKSPYDSPFVFRFGFQLSELALLKKK